MENIYIWMSWTDLDKFVMRTREYIMFNVNHTQTRLSLQYNILARSVASFQGSVQWQESDLN